MKDSPAQTPTHVGFIMDGNRRWAKGHALEVAKGHLAGSETLENILGACGDAGIRHATFFSFSTENWHRTPEEVEGLMSLILAKIGEKRQQLQKMGARVLFVGRKSDFSDKLQEAMKELEKLTSKGEKLTVNFAVSYGGRAEIVDAVNAVKGKKGEITEADIQTNLYESGQPDLDLVIRTGGESRLSGFMMWQTTYAELYFTPILWPDFDGVELEKALSWYADVKRNFGK